MKNISYTIMNPLSGEPIMSRIPASRLDEMVRYFAWMTGVRPSTMVVKKTTEKPLQMKAALV